jgi:hypothetical protein
MTLSRSQIPGAVARREEFKGSSIQGGPTTPVHAAMIMTGRLPNEWRHRLIDDAPVYVVWSYGTPIAWVTSAGTPVVPDVKYSTTTSAHQSLAAEGLTGERKKFRTSL